MYIIKLHLTILSLFFLPTFCIFSQTLQCRENLLEGINLVATENYYVGVNKNITSVVTGGVPALVDGNINIKSGAFLKLSVRNLKLKRDVIFKKGSNVKIETLGCTQEETSTPSNFSGIRLKLAGDAGDACTPIVLNGSGTLVIPKNYHFEIQYDRICGSNGNETCNLAAAYHPIEGQWTLKLASGKLINGQNTITDNSGQVITFICSGITSQISFNRTVFSGHSDISRPCGFCPELFQDAELWFEKTNVPTFTTPKIKFSLVDASVANPCGSCETSPLKRFFTLNSGREGNIENLLSSTFSLSPNPSNGIFTLQKQTEEAIDVVVYDLLGQVIWSQNGIAEPSTSINLEGKPRGIYQAKITSNTNKPTIMKLVLE
jgi:hypothetical protein